MKRLEAARNEANQANKQLITPDAITRREVAVSALESAQLQAIAATHNADADCTVDPENDCCVVCGVYHGGYPCNYCHGRAFHLPTCPSYFDANYRDPDDESIHSEPAPDPREELIDELALQLACAKQMLYFGSNKRSNRAERMAAIRAALSRATAHQEARRGR